MRRALPDRRFTLTFSYEHNGRRFVASVGQFSDGSMAEIFVNTTMKAGSEADVNCSDGAVAISLALQYGCPVDVLRAALKREANGDPQGPLARALDLYVKEIVVIAAKEDAGN